MRDKGRERLRVFRVAVVLVHQIDTGFGKARGLQVIRPGAPLVKLRRSNSAAERDEAVVRVRGVDVQRRGELRMYGQGHVVRKIKNQIDTQITESLGTSVQTTLDYRHNLVEVLRPPIVLAQQVQMADRPVGCVIDVGVGYGFLESGPFNRDGDPCGPARCLDPVPVSPIGTRVLHVIEKHEDVGMGELLEVTEPRQIGRLQDGGAPHAPLAFNSSTSPLCDLPQPRYQSGHVAQNEPAG